MIRMANLDDAGAVRDIAIAAYAGYVDVIGKKPAPMKADFPSQIRAEQVFVLMAEHNRVVGYAVCYPRNDHMHLENIAVHPDHEGRGHGKALISFVEARALCSGLSAVELYTNAAMVENLSIYPHLGFRETGRRREDGFERVFFRKDF